jgi:hypothetical protein
MWVIQGVPSVVDCCAFKWIAFSFCQGFEPPLALLPERGCRCCFGELLNGVDPELKKLLIGLPERIGEASTSTAERDHFPSGF